MMTRKAGGNNYYYRAEVTMVVGWECVKNHNQHLVIATLELVLFFWATC